MFFLGEDNYHDLIPSFPNTWHAMFVFTGREDHVKKMLDLHLAYENCGNIRTVVPRRRLRERKGGVWRDVDKPLFPGYILLNGHLDMTAYRCISDVHSFKRILRNHDEFSLIAPDEIKVLNRLTYNGDLIGFSKVFFAGERVKVIEGPLLSLEGLIQSVDARKGRAKVSLRFLGEVRTVDLGVEILKPLQ